MPWMQQRVLDQDEAAELEAATRAIGAARLEWARTVRRLGVSACARYFGITTSALGKRLSTAEKAGGMTWDSTTKQYVPGSDESDDVLAGRTALHGIKLTPPHEVELPAE